jgi:hypothetical protein
MQPTTHPIADRLSLRPMLLPVAGLALALGGCNGAFIGNFVVLGLTLGVFFGTLGLGRTQRPSAGGSSSPSSTSADRSHH